MKKDMSRTKALLNDFSKARQVVTVNEGVNSVRVKRELKTTKKPTKSTSYLDKIERGDIEKLSSKDIMDFYKDTARNSGVKYIDSKPIISMSNINLAKKRDYSVEEILVMIEFLYTSEQDYLDKRKLHPGILLTGWCNKIYSDSQDWLKDEYKTDTKKKHVTREWSEEVPEEEEAEIGDWGI